VISKDRWGLEEKTDWVGVWGFEKGFVDKIEREEFVDSNDELFPLDNEGEPSFPMTQVIFLSLFEL